MPITYTYERLENLGRLGNQLWQIASTIGVADRDGAVPLFREDWEYRSIFSVPEELFGPLPRVYKDPSYLLKDDYLQQYAYWSVIKDKILAYFEPTDEVRLGVIERFHGLTDGGHVTALHVRRGDYLKHPDLFPACTMRYFDAALKLIRIKHPDTQVLVFSDDIPWCRQNFPSEYTFVEGVSRPVEMGERKRTAPEDYWDLLMMAMCDSHIISNSSFSYWGATLADQGDVYYPSVWYGGKFLSIPWTGMIPDDWKKVRV